MACRVVGSVCVLLLLVLILMGLDFHRRHQPSAVAGLSAEQPPQAAVVFTGQYDRIEAGLSLFDDGKVNWLLITGVNAGAGLDPKTFAQQFNVSSRVSAGIQAGRIVLGTEAQNTLENACETARWWSTLPTSVRRQGVILVTSYRHMPRASLALMRQLEGATIWRWPLPQSPFDEAELKKYAATAAGYGRWWSSPVFCA